MPIEKVDTYVVKAQDRVKTIYMYSSLESKTFRFEGQDSFVMGVDTPGKTGGKSKIRRVINFPITGALTVEEAFMWFDKEKAKHIDEEKLKLRGAVGIS